MTLLGRDDGVLVTVEVKLPYQKGGGTPYHSVVVRDARAKAQRAGARFFFTWNVNECVLWDAESVGGDPGDRRELDDAVLELLGVVNPRERLELRQSLYAWLREFFEHTRQKEEKAIANKNKAKRKLAATPDEIAAQVLADIGDRFGCLLRPYAEFVDFDQPASGSASQASNRV